MREVILVIFGLTAMSFIEVIGQNIVPNPSFEIYDTCPDDFNQIERATGWVSCGYSPDYYNSCTSHIDVSVPYNFFGFQQPPSLNCHAYMGIASWSNGSSEYAGIYLSQSLIIGQKYYISFKVNLGNISNCAENNMGILFSTRPFCYYSVDSLQNFAHLYSMSIISDTVNWITVSGSLIADSSYTFLTIGRFFDPSHTDTILINSGTVSYYYIDDVCVSRDSAECIPYAFNCDLGRLEDPSLASSVMRISPNPTTTRITLQLPPQFGRAEKIQVYDRLGRLLLSMDYTPEMDVSSLAGGLYYVVVRNEDGERVTGRFVKESSR